MNREEKNKRRHPHAWTEKKKDTATFFFWYENESRRPSQTEFWKQTETGDNKKYKELTVEVSTNSQQ